MKAVLKLLPHRPFVLRQARKALDPAIRRRIAELNALDGRLYEEGAALLQARWSLCRSSHADGLPAANASAQLPLPLPPPLPPSLPT